MTATGRRCHCGRPIPASSPTDAVFCAEHDDAPEPPPVVYVAATDNSQGCSHCGSQQTVQLHPHRGRLCPDAITLPPGGFRRDLAEHMADLGRADAALAYLGLWLQAETDRRFAEAAAR